MMGTAVVAVVAEGAAATKGVEVVGVGWEGAVGEATVGWVPAEKKGEEGGGAAEGAAEGAAVAAVAVVAGMGGGRRKRRRMLVWRRVV